MPDQSVHCPLCARASGVVDDALLGREILRLWSAHGDSISLEGLLPLKEDTKVELLRCRECGFRFFDPHLTGSARFYAELARTGYYAEAAPEFLDVLKFAEKTGVRSVTDVGCGDGAFLNLAAARGLKTAGLELTPTAAERARSSGHKIASTPLEKLSPGEIPPADMVTLFQVLEHVAQPVDFVRRAQSLVRAGGLLVISVPYDGGINGMATLLPHQWPPHHITRWRHSDLRRLGEVSSLELLSLRAGRLSGAELRRYLRLQNQLGRVLDQPRRAIPAPIITGLGWLYSLVGAGHWGPAIGPNTTAIFRVKSDRANTSAPH